MSEEKTKTYTNGQVTVVWNPEACSHSANCWRGLSSVFNPKIRPWINLDGGTTEQIKEQVGRCPSGALSLANAETPANEPSPASRIEVVPNGPLRYFGDIDLKHSDGRTERRERATSFCRCGLSANKPFCDGTHKREGWQE